MGRLEELLTLPELTEESTDCPECGASVEWDTDPDIGDCVVCDTCKARRFDEIQTLLMVCVTCGLPQRLHRAMRSEPGNILCLESLNLDVGIVTVSQVDNRWPAYVRFECGCSGRVFSKGSIMLDECCGNEPCLSLWVGQGEAAFVARSGAPNE